MHLAVPRESHADETRVAATPETVRKLVSLGLDVCVQNDAGGRAGYADADYEGAGAALVPDAAGLYADADIVFAVRPPDDLALLRRGCLLLCIAEADGLRAAAWAGRGIDVLAMEWLPRITRAQSMDVLSSQANLAGYRAVIEAAGAFERGFPMMMTAAGTVPPARVFVLGAGVAGLQAIATARRLGAIVSATDVRPAAREEIKSLGASFIGVEDAESAAAQTAGGYAREMSDGYRAKQAELLAATLAKTDIAICTALTMGRRAPILLSAAHVASMKPGSVIVDIAADAGGNCALTQPGAAIKTANGVTILGWRNWAGRLPNAASALYARNLLTFLTTFWDKAAGVANLPATDPIVAGAMLTRGGAVVHPSFVATPVTA